MRAAIIGGGPAGVFCAIKLIQYFEEKNLTLDITIFDDKNILSTLLPTGNGRCNLGYDEDNYRELASFYPRGEKFLYSIFSRYGKKEAISDFEKLGVKTYVQDDLRIFPKENKSAYVKQKMLEAIYGRVKFERKRITEPLKGFDAVVLATGLKSGAELAKKYGHTIIDIKPALTGLNIKEKEFCKLKGVSLKGVIFTDLGVSGPLIYKLSSINAYKNFPYPIKIPLLEVEQLKEALKNNPKKQFKTVLSEFIPKSLSEILVKSEKQAANVSNKEAEELAFLNLTATGVDGRGEVVHAGGVCLNETDKNLKSKIAENLWIVGEVLDIDGFTGGFNLQNCWSTSAIAAADILKKFS